MKRIKLLKYLILILMVFLPLGIYAQDDLLSELDSLAEPTTDYADATFKATRVITAQSVQNMHEGQLEFRIAHRFGSFNSGVDNLWGLDQSTIYLSLEYGVTDWLELGIGRTSYEKTVSGFSKIRILRQSTGDFEMPLSLSYVGNANINTSTWEYPDRENLFSTRLSYSHQLLIARKFNEEFSLQLSPTLIHQNLVKTALDDNDVFALGVGARYKLTSRVSVNAEYFYTVRPTWNISNDFKDAISIGLDIETGGHVFQIMLSNSIGMIDKHYISDNKGSWDNGDIHLGFNISRVFTIY